MTTTSQRPPGDVSPEPAGSTAASTQSPQAGSRLFLGGYGALFMAAALALFTAYIIYGIITMEVPDSAQSPGPKLYPTLLAVISSVLVVLLVVDTFRHPEKDRGARYNTPVGEEPTEAAIPAVQETSPGHLAIAVVAFGLFALVLEPVGWIISAALLFWAITLTLGGKRPVLNLAVGLVVSSAIQVAFSAGLGLSLPAGVLGGIF